MTKTNTTTTAPTTAATCLCGCGQEVNSVYRPGHDAKHVSILLAELYDALRSEWAQDEDKFVELYMERYRKLSGALAVKFHNALVRRMYRDFDRWSDKVNKGKGAVAPFSFHPDDMAHRLSRTSRGVA